MSRIPSLLFVGGFLGAGKTTAILSLAGLLADQGLTSSAITNDQTRGLVDTYFLSGDGVPTEEVAGSCFCCNFDGLASAVDRGLTSVSPDIVLAEPVGSCTDIVATVIRPMLALMSDRVEVKAYSVLVEPDRWQEFGNEASKAPWSMKFLFDKQLKEADIIVLTKADTLSEDECAHMVKDIGRSYPDAEVLAISSKNGRNLREWLERVRSSAPGENWLKEIDYQRYAEAEAEMGWLNAQASVEFPEPKDGITFAAGLIESMRQGVVRGHGQIGHLKILAVGRTGSIKAGITGVNGAAGMEGIFTCPVSALAITVNIRATLSPEELSTIVTGSLAELRQRDKVVSNISYMDTFRPAPPKPTYRYAS